MNPKVSVIVPVYKTEQYLEECLNSIVMQSLREIEIIIINDASPDMSREIIERFLKTDNRIVFLDKTVNEGVAAARNDGIKAAKGEFVCFMDSDDLYPNKEALQKLYNAAVENRVSVSGGKIEKILEGKVISDDKTTDCFGAEFLQNGLTDYCDYQYDYGYTGYLYSKKLLLDNDLFFPPYSRFQDPPFFVRAMYAAGKYFFLDCAVYRYRILPDSAKYSMKKAVDMLSGIMDNLAFSREKGLDKLHFLSACRLDHEASFATLQNLFLQNEDPKELYAKLVRANSLVDAGWLKDCGYDIKEPFLSEALEYTLQLAKKYNDIRNKKLVLMVKRLIGK